jgi:hypothetical protein
LFAKDYSDNSRHNFAEIFGGIIQIYFHLCLIISFEALLQPEPKGYDA